MMSDRPKDAMRSDECEYFLGPANSAEKKERAYEGGGDGLGDEQRRVSPALGDKRQSSPRSHVACIGDPLPWVVAQAGGGGLGSPCHAGTRPEIRINEDE